MANPQRENGFTGISNEIIDKLALIQLNGTQFRIILVVFRYTYGFQRKSHEISEAFLAKATGIHRQQIKRELKELLNRNILLVVREASFKKPRIISFEKDYEKWTGKLISTEVSKTIPDSENDTPTGSELDTSPGSELDTQERNIKENLKKDIVPYSEIVDYLNLMAETRYRSSTKDTRKHIHARWDEGFRLEDFKKVISKKSMEWKDDPCMSKYLRPSTLFGPKFESYLNEKIILSPLPDKPNKPKIVW